MNNDILRKQEWRLLFGSDTTTSLTQASQSLLPSEYKHDTFLVKSFFSETEKYYLVLITNLKQCWCEKLEIEDIRQRSKLSLFVSFDFGLASVQWEFKLSPMLASTGLHGQDPEINLSDDDDGLFSLATRKNTKGKSVSKRGRLFLEDSDAEGQDGGGKTVDEEHERDITDVLHGFQDSSNTGVAGMSVMYDHLLLPLISLANAYRKQTKALEVVIKSKESEVMEALEMLEQNGINYHNRRKATERYDKSWTESKIQETSKQIEELERRRLLQEQLDKEKAAKEKSRKKKRLF
ncbi:hypothetical protein BG011_001769 [Mortierella polycephala]|uniref:XLF-like N-terminal domain-containing protein n=1 Tax=Mortierella polycephala TaxID=41804 RepID=A0A9P6UAR7_9FUNG|nr:hypothetical protein BG011_001769 [Mortierella polycephala]